jgi:hypothetical protein
MRQQRQSHFRAEKESFQPGHRRLLQVGHEEIAPRILGHLVRRLLGDVPCSIGGEANELAENESKSRY